MFAEYVLQTSVQDAARLVRTGQAQDQQLTADDFKDEVCKLSGIVMDCTDITVYMTSATSFAALEAAVPSADEVGNSYGGPVGPTSYSCGAPSQAVALIATYDWNFSVPFLGQHFGNVDGGSKRRLAGITIFQNEPFPDTGNDCQ
jgi:Flp pilus assembly protein TadG